MKITKTKGSLSSGAIIFILLAAVLVAVVYGIISIVRYINEKPDSDAYETGWNYIFNGEYDKALEAFEKVNFKYKDVSESKRLIIYLQCYDEGDDKELSGYLCYNDFKKLKFTYLDSKKKKFVDDFENTLLKAYTACSIKIKEKEESKDKTESETGETSSASSGHKVVVPYDKFDVNYYEHPDDFYYDHIDDFIDFEEAEEYFEAHHI